MSQKVNNELYSVCEIRPYLCISGFCTLTAQKFHQNQITHAVDATNIPNALTIPDIEYLTVPVNDTETSQLSSFFMPVANFVLQAKNLVNRFLKK